MPNFTNITIAGHLGSAPETRETPSGQSVTSFSMATNKKRGQEDLTTWWRCQCWGRRGEVIAQYLGKGDALLVTGECYMRPWTAQDGSQRQSLEVDVRDFSFLGKSASASEQAAPASPRQATAMPSQSFDEDVPF